MFSEKYKIGYKKFLNNLRLNDNKNIIFVAHLKDHTFFIRFIPHSETFRICKDIKDTDFSFPNFIRYADTLFTAFRKFQDMTKDELIY